MAYAIRQHEANGLRHQSYTWTPAGESRGHAVLCHGFLDFGLSFRFVAERLADQGYTTTTFDWRGHGETEHIGAGGYYHFPDYVLDLAELLPQLSAQPVHLVGHSMGGTACNWYAGAIGDGLRTLSLLEGLGIPPVPAESGVERLRTFVRGVQATRKKSPRYIASVEEALTRMRAQNPQLDEARGLWLAEQATRPVTDDDGHALGRIWKFDPLHRTTAPVPFNYDAFMASLRAIEVPTLVVLAEHGYRLKDEATRLGAIANHRSVEVPGVGHMLHWDAPEALADALLQHFASVDDAR